MATFAQGLLDHECMLWERLAKFEGEAILKTMFEYCWDCKKCRQIYNEIMIFHGFSRPYVYGPYAILNERLVGEEDIA
jgi:hypothetical protein